MCARVWSFVGARTCVRDAAHDAAHVSVCACARVGTHAFAGSRTWGMRACVCMRVYAYMIYHIGLSNNCL